MTQTGNSATIFWITIFSNNIVLKVKSLETMLKDGPYMMRDTWQNELEVQPVLPQRMP